MKLTSSATSVLALCTAMLAGSLAFADENETRINVMKVDSKGSDPVVMQFSTDQSFDDLADGESRVINSNDGQSATVTRTGDQLTISTSDGQEATVPFMRAGAVHIAHHDEAVVEKHVRIVHKSPGEPSNQIMIIAPDGLSDQEKQAIRDAMLAAGVDRELHFMGDDMHSEIDIQIESNN